MTEPEAVPPSQRHGMVVGVDGTEPSIAALAWAAARTDRFGPVRPVYVWDYPLSAWAPSPFGPGAVPPVAEMQQAAEEAAATSIEALADVDHHDPLVVQGDAASVLVDAAGDANLLVVGTRGRGPVRANMLGSVGRHCADHTPVPMVIVPELDEPSLAGPAEEIVVGIDGSDGSLEALRWAVSNAPASSTIRAVAAWQTPVDGPLLYGVNRFDIKALKASATTTVVDAAEKVCAELGVDNSRVTREITEGDPRWVLMNLSETADLLVLGQRSRAGISHVVLGSATTALIHRPKCPTAVIPPPAE